MNDPAKLLIDGEEIDLPVTVGTEDERGIDISKLRGETGYITLDEGFVNTGSTSSDITFLDGEKESSGIVAIPSSNSRRTAISSRSVIC